MTIHNAGDLVGNRYLITGWVGEGGMQEVYRAADQLLNRDVALKTPKTASATKRFKRSAHTAAKINQSNIAKTLDYVEESGKNYLVEELVEGCNLAVFLKSYVPRLDPYACAQVIHHMARGLAASHHAGVIHRDMKPTNVIVVGGASFGGIKITDFGIAKMAEAEIERAAEGGDLTASETALGALPYMSPEMIQSFSDAGMPTDVWSLGAMGHELLTGTRPFGSNYRAAALIEAGVIPELKLELMANNQFSGLVEQIYQITSACMTKDVRNRPTADDVVRMCENLCYSDSAREFGYIARWIYGTSGFISADTGQDVFFHTNSVPSGRVVTNDRVWFSRHPGSPRPRAFPLVKAKSPEPPAGD